MIQSIFLKSLTLVAFVLALATNGLWLEPKNSKALDNLSKNVSKIPGGYFPRNLTEQPYFYEDLKHIVLFAIDSVQDADSGNFSNPDTNKYKLHELIDIKEVNQQIVSGTNYDVIFTVGVKKCQVAKQENATSASAKNADKYVPHRSGPHCFVENNGTFGRCNFVIYSQPWTGILQVTKSVCVETTRDNAYL